MARTYLEILLAAADCAVIVPSEMMLQAKAVVTAEALDLVLYPEFQFTEEARPIVARELARRATPRRILRLLSLQLDRGLGASESGESLAPQAASSSIPYRGRVSASPDRESILQAPEDGGSAGYSAFWRATHDRHGKGRPWTEDARQMAAYWEEESRGFARSEYWEDKQMTRSSLKSLLTLLRLLIDQLAQAVEARQK
jgi:hypothetical protein